MRILNRTKKQIVFVVLVDSTVCGVLSVNAIDKIHLKSDWAFYLDANVRGGLGAALEFSLIKSGQRIGVYFLGLTKSEWESVQDSVKNRYKKVIDKFEINVEYEPA